MSRVQQRAGTKAKRECPVCHNKVRRWWTFDTHVIHCRKKAARRAERTAA